MRRRPTIHSHQRTATHTATHTVTQHCNTHCNTPQHTPSKDKYDRCAADLQQTLFVSLQHTLQHNTATYTATHSHRLTATHTATHTATRNTHGKHSKILHRERPFTDRCTADLQHKIINTLQHNTATHFFTRDEY